MILLLLFLIAMPKHQNQKIHCAHVQIFCMEPVNKECRWTLKYLFRIFFGWVKIWRMALIPKKFCLIKFQKIDEKVFYNRLIGVWTKSKNEYFLEIYITQAFYWPLSWNFTTTPCCRVLWLFYTLDMHFFHK